MQQQKNDKTTYLLLALTTVLWGSLYTASKVLLDVIQPFTLLCLRYIMLLSHVLVTLNSESTARYEKRGPKGPLSSSLVNVFELELSDNDRSALLDAHFL